MSSNRTNDKKCLETGENKKCVEIGKIQCFLRNEALEVYPEKPYPPDDLYQGSAALGWPGPSRKKISNHGGLLEDNPGHMALWNVIELKEEPQKNKCQI